MIRTGLDLMDYYIQIFSIPNLFLVGHNNVNAK